MTAVLAGNQNCGKTLLFNVLTGQNARVGNFPGVTVERRRGIVKNTDIMLTDLPGTYSLLPLGEEEAVTRDFILGEHIDVIINVVDVNNLARSLYLSLQLAELGVPMVLALGFADEAKKNGLRVDISALEAALGVRTVSVSARERTGIDALIKAVKAKPVVCQLPVPSFGLLKPDEQKIEQAYNYIDELTSRCILSEGVSKIKERTSAADKFLLGRFTALPVLLAALSAVFTLSFGAVGGLASEALAELFGHFSAAVEAALARLGASPIFVSFAADGVLSGTLAVLEFLPRVLILFFLLSVLEDSGYMARAVYLVDRPLSTVGLSGRCFVPLLLGFGCTVPAVMSARTLFGRRDKKLTALLVPFVPCSAKLTVFWTLAAAFFEERAFAVVALACAAGLAAGLLYALFFKNVFGGEPMPFMIELPPYRLPSLGSSLKLTSRRASDFLKKVFTVILASSVLVWTLQNIGPDFAPCEAKDSLLASAASGLSFLFEPLGFGDWRAAASVLAGLSAKEAVISSLSVLLGGEPLSSLLSAPSALSLLCFIALYMPCLPSAGAIKRELGSLYQAVLAMVTQTGVAWLASFAVYRIALSAFRG